jgi:hypothetical protein
MLYPNVLARLDSWLSLKSNSAGLLHLREIMALEVCLQGHTGIWVVTCVINHA